MAQIKRHRTYRVIAQYATELSEKYQLPKLSPDEFFNICPYTKTQLLKSNRKQDYVEWRALYYTICFLQLRNYSLTCEFVQARDHVIVRYAIKTLEKWYDLKDNSVIDKFNLLKNQGEFVTSNPKCHILFIKEIVPKKQKLNYD